MTRQDNWTVIVLGIVLAVVMFSALAVTFSVLTMAGWPTWTWYAIAMTQSFAIVYGGVLLVERYW